MVSNKNTFKVVEICAGAGGQGLGLEKAGFEHELAVEIDSYACQTLAMNRPSWKIAQGDVADRSVWKPERYAEVDLLAGGVPCPPFSIAGKQLGAGDERDLFAWAVQAAVEIRPRALLLENVRGLSMPRFAAYRQHVLDTLAGAGYVGQWRLLQASHFGVPQLRPRFVLAALQEKDAPYFAWPEPEGDPGTVGEVLRGLMEENDWEHAAEWAQLAKGVAPTIVGGSKKHGGADLGPTRAKRAWAELFVDGLGIANEPPAKKDPHPEEKKPKLTVEMVKRLQGWDPSDKWELAGRKTAQYRQVGNAFPPPMAEAVGRAIHDALSQKEEKADLGLLKVEHDGVYRALREADGYVSFEVLRNRVKPPLDPAKLEQHVANLSKDFQIDFIRSTQGGVELRLGDFRAFTGQEDHERHAAFATRSARSRIS
jgi:DNA (cytosine-5)-methyltransferase 1